MTWFKVDDSFHSHPKTEAASLAALGLWAVAGSWSSDHLTDGAVPDHVIPRLSRGSSELADELVAAGLWRRTKGGYRFHQWHDRNPSREEVASVRALSSSGGALGNHRRWHAGKGRVDPRCAYCQGKHDRGPDRPPDRGSDGHTDSPPNPPDPSRPDPEEEPPKPPKGGESDPGFDIFWAAYPRKVGKATALKKWRAALKRGHNPDAITAAARRYAAARRGQDVQYTAHPATWLHGERYNDTEQPSAETGGWWTN